MLIYNQGNLMNAACRPIRTFLLLAAWLFAVASASADANLDTTVRTGKRHYGCARLGVLDSSDRQGDPTAEGCGQAFAGLLQHQRQDSVCLRRRIRRLFRGVLIHEMVHALQDQQFGLDKLHDSAEEDDSALAKTALIEGDATYTMIEVLKKSQPKVTAML